MVAKKKFFLITIDTEGDNLWNVRCYPKPLSRISNRNGAYLERFQLVCEKYGFVPTYLVNYEMAMSEPFIDMAKRHARQLEIGMHMHAFNTPPFYQLPNYIGGNKAYAGEYPLEIQLAKITGLTKLLRETFHSEITAHRGGRWYMDTSLVRILVDCGYLVDCTVTPEVDWRTNKGQTEGSHGINYSKAPHAAYRMTTEHVCLAGNSGMYEVPMTVRKKRISLLSYINKFDLWRRQTHTTVWMRPNGHNLHAMLELARVVHIESTDYIEFMLHSSELMPGGSPTFQTKESIELLYQDIECLFMYIKELGYQGMGLTGYERVKK